MSKPSYKKEIYCHNTNLYWPTSIEDTNEWFSFLNIMEHTENILKPKQGIVASLLKVFAIIELRLIDDIDKVEAIATRCINYKKETYLYLRTSTLE